MANEYLSQDEIDALLKQSSDEPGLESPGNNLDHYLSSLEQDALGEIGNITFGSAATALSTLLGKKVEITTPQVTMITHDELVNEFPQPHVAIHVDYLDGFNGINLLVIKTEDAQVIADLMMGGDGTNKDGVLDDIHISAVQEAMNQMMGSSATSMSTIFNRFVNISPPGINILDLSNGGGNNILPDGDVFIKVAFRLIIGDLIDSTLMQLLPFPFAKEMVDILMGGNEMMDEHSFDNTSDFLAPLSPVSSTATQPLQQPMYQQELYEQPMFPNQPYQQSYQQQQQQQQQQPPYQQQSQYQQQPQFQQQQQFSNQPPAAYGNMINRNVNVQPVQFSNLSAGPQNSMDETNLGLLLDIPLKVTVELGRTKKVIKDILELSQGSIIELDKLAGEPVDILVNNKLIAKGEVVVIDENFGVRVTDIINQWDRIQKLQ